MTAIKINTYPVDDGDFFNEDITGGVYRIGRNLERNRDFERILESPASFFPISDSTIEELNLSNIVSSSLKIKSGIQLQYGPAGLEFPKFINEIIGDSNSQIKTDFIKIKQGVSLKSTFDLHADFLPFTYMQGGKSPYPWSIHQRFNPTFDEDFFGIKEELSRTNYVPFEDIIVVSPGYMSASDYLQINNAFTNKLYPLYSGSHYTNPYQLIGTMEPFELTRSRHEIKLVDQVSYFTARRYVFGISANLMISEREEAGLGKPYSVKKGGTFIDDKIEIRYDKNKSSERFDDAKSIVRFNNRIDATIGTTESEGLFDFIPYDDIFDPIEDLNSYNFLSSKPIQYQPLTSSISTMSIIGTRYISANAGYIYESTTLGNTTLGTDSIAFGGLNRRG